MRAIRMAICLILTGGAAASAQVKFAPSSVTATGGREDTLLRIDIVATGRDVGSGPWEESKNWIVGASVEGQVLKRLVNGPSKVSRVEGSGQMSVEFKVYFETPAEKMSVDVTVSPPGGGREHKITVDLPVSSAWHRVALMADGGPKLDRGRVAVSNGRVFAVAGTRRKPELARAAGDEWVKVEGLPAREAPQSVAGFDYGIVVATNASLQRSDDGKTWEKLTRPVRGQKLSLTAGDRLLVAVGNKRALYCSADGKKWQRGVKGLPRKVVTGVAVMGKVVHVGLLMKRNTEALYRSTDGCKTFHLVPPDGPALPEGVARWQLVLQGGQTYAALLDAGYPAAVMRWDDAGSKWQRSKLGGLPRIAHPPILLAEGDTVYLVADGKEVYAADGNSL